MKQFKKVLGIVMISMLLILGFSGVVKTKAGVEIYKSTIFNSTNNSTGVNNYTSEWTNTTSEFTVSLSYFNNNNNGWAYVRCGNKSSASVCTIITDAVIDEAITKVVVTVDSFRASNVNSFKLYVASDSAFAEDLQEVSLEIASGANTFTIPSPAENMYYKIAVDCKKDTSNGTVQISKIDYYRTTSDPSVEISGNSNLKVGGSITLTGTPNNMSAPYTKTFASSNTSVATITDEGVLTGVSKGTTNITCTINGVTSSAFAVKVWTDNSSSISIELAESLAELADATDSPYEYKARGTIKSITNTTTFVLTDGENDINVYKPSHGFTASDVGTKLEVNGSLKMYSSKAQFNQPTIKNVYTVTFNSNEGSSVASIDALSGEKIDEPATPTKAGFTFVKWNYGLTQWHFDSDTVTSDMELQAEWVDNSLVAMQTAVNNIKPYFSLGFTYRKNAPTPNDTDTLDLSFTSISGTSYKDWSDKTGDSGAVYKGNSAGGNSAIQMRTSNSNSGIVTTTSGGFVRKITITWNTNTAYTRQLDFYGKDSAYEAASDLYNNEKKGTLLGSLTYSEIPDTELIITSPYEYIGIRSHDSALYIDSIEIEWVSTWVTYTDVDFRLKIAVDAGVSSISDIDDYGIKVFDNALEQHTKYYDSSKLVTSDGKTYLVIGLGDILNNIDRSSLEFTISAYVQKGDTKLVSTTTKTYSIKSLISYYITNSGEVELNAEDLDLLNALKSDLINLGVKFN